LPAETAGVRAKLRQAQAGKAESLPVGRQEREEDGKKENYNLTDTFPPLPPCRHLYLFPYFIQ
jgi:hypothetical protein